MIELLSDRAAFRQMRDLAWQQNAEYWTSQPLRHVADVGEYIVDRVELFCRSLSPRVPTVLDMGFGNAWLLEHLLRRKLKFAYVGIDATKVFVDYARRKYENIDFASFHLGDVEGNTALPAKADVVVNAFNFFELCDLRQAMENAAKALLPQGRLFVTTIDKTYLILALSSSWEEFHENLKRYEALQGLKFSFQRIDLDTSVSQTLEYPSVLYSLEDFLDNAARQGLKLIAYKEHVFTAKLVPKIYCHMEFEQTGVQHRAERQYRVDVPGLNS